MKNKFTTYDDELDLVELLKTIWNGKVKIILITFISFLIGIGYNLQKPNEFITSAIVKSSVSSEFGPFSPIYNFVGVSQQRLYSNEMLNRFVSELGDYEELVFVLKKNKYIEEKILKLSQNDQPQILHNYAKSLKISRIDDIQNGIIIDSVYKITFNWHNAFDGRSILEETIKLTLINLEKKFFNQLEAYLEVKKNSIFNEDLSRIEYLLEQAKLARELNIAENELDNNSVGNYNVFNFNNSDIAYYLRGYKIIDREISIIKSRKHHNLSFFQKRIHNLKKIDVNWVEYNNYLIETTSSKNYLKVLMISIVLGLMIGSMYVLISNKLQPQKSIRKKTN